MNPRSLLSVSVLFSLAACGGGGGGGGGGSGGGTPITPPPHTVPASPAGSGVIAAAAGSGQARIDVTLPGTGFEAALFQGSSAGTVYAGAPVQAPLATSSPLVNGLTDGSDVFFGLAVRATGTTPWTPVGAVVRVRPAAPLYVDASASAAGANGLSPATAFPSLADAMLVAGAQNGGNVWVRTGDYGNGPFALGPNVHVAGGFDGTFTLAARAPAGGGTRLVGSTTQELVSVQTGGSDGTLDGLVLDPANAVLKGVDVVDGDVELRSLTIRRCLDRGIKVVATTPTPNRRLAVIACNVLENGGDGASTAGPVDLVLAGSHFDANVRKGFDVDDLQCPDNGSVSLLATSSRWFGNGLTGLEVDLAAAPLAAGTGAFVVRIDNCRFELNGADGLLLDQEHEAQPGFAADLEVRGSLLRGNRLAGVRIDADARGTAVLTDLRCTANATDGVQVTSETTGGEILLQGSWLAGNLGAGARVVSGNKTLLVAHCGFAGNAGGGVRSDTGTAGVANSVFTRQGAPRTGVVGDGNVDADAVFVNAPTAFATVTAASLATLTVSTNSGFAGGTDVVVGDDDTRRAVLQSAATSLVLDTAPTALLAPTSVAAYASSNVVLDLTPSVGSAAENAGVAPIGTTAPDAGPAAIGAGDVPGGRSPLRAATLQLLRTSPSLSVGVGGTTPLVLSFDRAVDVASLTADRVLVERNGVPIAVNLSSSGTDVTLAPTAAWSGTVTVTLQGDLRGQDGSALAAPVVLPVRVL